jgi:hypothetical protein
MNAISGLLLGVKDMDFLPLLTLAVLLLAPPPSKLVLLLRVGVEAILEEPTPIDILPPKEEEE